MAVEGSAYSPSDAVAQETDSNGDYVIFARPEEGRPVQVISADDEAHQFVLDEDALRSILLRPDVADKQVAVISVAGAFRRGKSFMLNFFLKYLHQKGSDWLGDDDSPLEGFSWRGGAERDTSGLILWSKPFLINTYDGKEIAVLLIDTQGAFDSQSTVKDCATIFALATMLSSVQIYNLSQNIQEDDLQHLQLFTEYGRLALESDMTPFQSLVFLVRDWSFPYEAEYGFKGGYSILKRRLEISEKQHPELRQLRQHIHACFADISCFLMPHPGLKVATSPSFRGQLCDVESEFKRQLHHFVPHILKPNNLLLKEINGQAVTCRELMEYFRSYIKIFQGEDLPEPKSMLLATAEANNLAAVSNARALYCKKMDELCGGEAPYLAPEDLEQQHVELREQSIRLFRSSRKMGGDEFSLAFLSKLEEELKNSFENYARLNNGKNIFRSAKAPAVLFVVVIVFYFLQELFMLLRIGILASACSSLLGMLLITFCLWTYIRYSGHMRELGQTIDTLTEIIWLQFLRPISHVAITAGVRHATNFVPSAIVNTTSTTSANDDDDNAQRVLRRRPRKN